jgi:hypothetical protein
MICEKCQTKEANAHLTHKFPLGPEHREPSVAFQLHLCEECAAAFKLEYDQFLQGQTAKIHQRLGFTKRATMKPRPKITGANGGGKRWLPTRKRGAAHIAQFWRLPESE